MLPDYRRKKNGVKNTIFGPGIIEIDLNKIRNSPEYKKEKERLEALEKQQK